MPSKATETLPFDGVVFSNKTSMRLKKESNEVGNQPKKNLNNSLFYEAAKYDNLKNSSFDGRKQDVKITDSHRQSNVSAN